MSNWKQVKDVDRGGACGRVQTFEYQACPGGPREPPWEGWIDGPVGEPAESFEHGQGNEPGAGSTGGSIKFRENQETRRAFAAGRECGLEEGRASERAKQAAARKDEEEGYKRQIAKLITDFAAEHDRFLQAVEHQVVKLALAVAARILRREAQMDPLLLMGAVRVALGQLAGNSGVTLRVPAEQLDLWTEAIALLPNPTMKPTLAPEEGMRLGDCVIESKTGTVDLGVRSQLSEIERGFFDRAVGRERSTPRDLGAAEVRK